MTLDEHRRKAQLRPWTKRWDWKWLKFESVIRPEDLVWIEIRTHIDPVTGEEIWERIGE